MNKKGSIFFVVLLSIIYFMAGMVLYQFLKPDITQARTDLVCSSPTTSGDMFTCLIIGGIIPIVIITILSTAGGYLTDKLLK